MKLLPSKKLIALIGLVGLLSPIFVSAQSLVPRSRQGEVGLRPAIKDLNETFNLLIAAKKSPLAGTDKEKIEINLRQSAFNDIIDVALAEIENLAKKLKNIADTEKYLETLADLEKYHQELRQQINRDLTLDELIGIARNFKLWREAVYQPKVDEIADLIFTTHNQKIIEMANNRFQRIKADLGKIEDAIQPAKWNRLIRLLNKAEESLAAAQKFNEEEPALVIEEIKEAYSYFLEMSKLVKK